MSRLATRAAACGAAVLLIQMVLMLRTHVRVGAVEREAVGRRAESLELRRALDANLALRQRNTLLEDALRTHALDVPQDPGGGGLAAGQSARAAGARGGAGGAGASALEAALTVRPAEAALRRQHASAGASGVQPRQRAEIDAVNGRVVGVPLEQQQRQQQQSQQGQQGGSQGGGRAAAAPVDYSAPGSWSVKPYAKSGPIDPTVAEWALAYVGAMGKFTECRWIVGEDGAPNVADAVAAVVVITHDRPAYLSRTVTSVLDHMTNPAKFPVYISQDGPDQAVQKVGEMLASEQGVGFMQHLEQVVPTREKRKENLAYYRIANHYKFALERLLLAKGFARVIILEDDMEVSPDFFDYFEATAPLLQADPSLYAVSSWNDHGQERFVRDPELLLRTDFFPGLGWMLTRELFEELNPRWPRAYWDDWMRLQETRRGRQTVRPEMCRTLNFGAKGASHGQYFKQYLAHISAASSKVPWLERDVGFLDAARWPGTFDALMEGARDFRSDAREAAKTAATGTTVVVRYGSYKEYKSACKVLGIMDDWKDGVPRGAYRGVVMIRYGQGAFFLAPTPEAASGKVDGLVV